MQQSINKNYHNNNKNKIHKNTHNNFNKIYNLK